MDKWIKLVIYCQNVKKEMETSFLSSYSFEYILF